MRISQLLVVVMLLTSLAASRASEGGSSVGNQSDLSHGLVGYWKFQGDCRDYSGHGNHAVNHGVDLAAVGQDGQANTAAGFSGKGCFLEVKNSEFLDLGTGQFSMSAWIWTEKAREVIGDLLTKYDPVNRKGFNWSVLSNQHRTPANRRTLSFGIDDGKLIPWADCGKCDTVGLWCLCVHNGHLYAGSFMRNNGAYSDMNPQGHVYRYEGGTSWTDCGRLGDSSNVLCLASYEGNLYGAVAYATGTNGPAGKVYRFDEIGNQWIDCGEVGQSVRVDCMAIHGGRLYAGITGGRPDSIYVYEGGTKWTSCEKTWGSSCSMGVYGDDLYATRGSEVFRHIAGSQWESLGTPGGEDNYQSWSFGIFEGELLVGAFPSGHVYCYQGGKEWLDYGRLMTTYQDNGQKEVMALTNYNGKIYGSVWPTGEVYRYDGNRFAWSYLAALGTQGHGSSLIWKRMGEKHGVGTGGTPWISNYQGEKPPKTHYYAGAPRISRTTSMALYQGKLFAATWNWEFDLPGHVYCTEAGRGITYDHILEPGWRHVAVVKDQGILLLYIDGKQVARSSSFDPKDYDISNDQTLKIGFGAYDYFKGKMNHVRIYDRALNKEEIQSLFLNGE